MNIMSIALPSLFAPPLSYMALIAGDDASVVWTGERYEKQTLRNRAEFLSSAGVFSFSIPVQKYPHPTPAISAIMVSEHGQWRPKLKHALRTAYSSAPFWEHYEELIYRAIEYKDSDFLVNFNAHWTNMLCALWDFPVPTQVSSISDTNAFHPELGNCSYKDQAYTFPRYWQVFEQKYGFIGGLSALDLLLTQGPEGRVYLMKLYESIR